MAETRRIRGPKSDLHRRREDALAEAKRRLEHAAGSGTPVGRLSESVWPEGDMFQAQAIGDFSFARSRRSRI
jgi:hypothetical protein